MRYLLVLLLFLFITEQQTYSQVADTSLEKSFNNKIPLNDTLPLTCEIIRIKKIDKAFIIDIKVSHISKFCGRYTIISLKSDKQDFKKIKKGKQYDFVLLAYHLYQKERVRTRGCNDIIINGFGNFTIDGVNVGFLMLNAGEIVTTPNLQGLYYIP